MVTFSMLLLVLGLPNIRYERLGANVSANATASKKRKRQAASADSQEGQQVEVEEKEEEQEENEVGEIPAHRYGALFSECKVGSIAVVAQNFDDTIGGRGVDLFSVKQRVEAAVGSVEEDYFIAGNKFSPTDKRMYVTDPRVLDGTWWKKPAVGTDKNVQVKGWQVLCYLKKLNKKEANFIISPARQDPLFEVQTRERQAITSFVESASESDERNDDVFEQDEDEVMEPCEEE